MEIRFYTPELNLIGIMENQTSLLWTRKFYEPGSFQLITPITDYNVRLCQLGNIISIDGADEAAVIECVTIRQEHSRRIITAVGRMLSSYFDRRLIRPVAGESSPTYKYSGTFEGAMRALISRLEHPIPLVRLGADNGFEETIVFQATYKNVLAYLIKLSRASNIGFRVVPDFTNKTLTFETYKGVDHSVHQSERTRVEFSEEFQNISTLKYQEDYRNYKNTYYMRDSNDNYWVLGYDEHTGLERREVLDTSGYSVDDLKMYVYNEPVYTAVLPTEKLTNIAVYGDDYDHPIYADTFYLKDASGNDVVVQEKLQQAAKQSVSGRYGPSYMDILDWTNKTPYGALFMQSGGKPSASSAFGITSVRQSGTWNYVASNPYDAKTGFTYVRSERRAVGYRQKITGYREETDAEFQARVDAYYRGLENWQRELAEYQEKYAMDLAAYKVREDSFYHKYRKIVNFECVVDPNGNFKYRRDYDLGDIVTAKKEAWGIEYDLRITEIQEIYEHGLMMVTPTLGDVMPETIDWEDK